MDVHVYVCIYIHASTKLARRMRDPLAAMRRYRNRATAGSYSVFFSYERGTPVLPPTCLFLRGPLDAMRRYPPWHM